MSKHFRVGTKTSQVLNLSISVEMTNPEVDQGIKSLLETNWSLELQTPTTHRLENYRDSSWDCWSPRIHRSFF